MQQLRGSPTAKMFNINFLRNTRKAYLYYAIGFSIIVFGGLVTKSFNDKIAVMTGSVHSYQLMVDKQSQQLKAVSMEKERLKRDLDDNDASLRNMRSSLSKLDANCKEKEEDLKEELSNLQNKYSTLVGANNKLDNKYKTLSKSNAEAIAHVESLTSSNKRLRAEVDDAASSKASELMKLRETLGKATQERDKYRDQYTALFHQHQQSLDSVQLLQEEKSRLQEQIREIQRLSGGVNSGKVDIRSSSAVPVVMEEPRIMAKPDNQISSSTSSTAAPPQEVVGAEPRPAANLPIPAAVAKPYPAASKPPIRVSKPPVPIAPAPPVAAAAAELVSKPSAIKPAKINPQVPIGAQVKKHIMDQPVVRSPVLPQVGGRYPGGLETFHLPKPVHSQDGGDRYVGVQRPVQYNVQQPQYVQRYPLQPQQHQEQYNNIVHFQDDNVLEDPQEEEEDDMDALQAPDSAPGDQRQFLYRQLDDGGYHVDQGAAPQFLQRHAAAMPAAHQNSWGRHQRQAADSWGAAQPADSWGAQQQGDGWNYGAHHQVVPRQQVRRDF